MTDPEPQRAQSVIQRRCLAAIMENLIAQGAPDSISGYALMNAVMPHLLAAYAVGAAAARVEENEACAKEADKWHVRTRAEIAVAIRARQERGGGK